MIWEDANTITTPTLPFEQKSSPAPSASPAPEITDVASTLTGRVDSIEIPTEYPDSSESPSEAAPDTPKSLEPPQEPASPPLPTSPPPIEEIDDTLQTTTLIETAEIAESDA